MGTLSGYYSTVQKILTRVTSNTLKEFEQLNTDEERVQYVQSLDYVQDAFNVKPNYDGKSAAESRKFREKGNTSFERRNYTDAFELYNKAVLWAPVCTTDVTGGEDTVGDVPQASEEFVLALGNRSATLFKLRECRRCLDDISVALKYGYPVQLQYKLFDRQARCYQELGQPENAVESLKNIFGIIAEADLDDVKKEHVLKGVKKQIAALEGTLIGDDLNVSDNSGSSSSTSDLGMPGALGEDDTLESPPLTGQESRTYPCASDSFQVKYGSDQGRYGVATRDVHPGDVVIDESPYVSILDPVQFNRRCYYCFRKVKVPIGCHQCMKVSYCCELCRERSWSDSHGMECAYLSPLLSSGTGSIAHLALNTVIKTGFSRIIKCKKNPFSDKQNAKQSLFTSKGVYMGGYMGLYNLVTHTQSRTRNDLLQYTILAIYLLHYVDDMGFFPSNTPEHKDRLCIGGILLRFLQIICCNAIEVMEIRTGLALQRSEPETIGLALYPTVSLLNHSCDPSLELIFYNNKCVVRAIQNVSAGKELYIDYGCLYYVTPKKQRRLSLKAQYFFECRCRACVRDWTVKSNLKSDIPILKCVRCACPLLSIFCVNVSPLAEEQDPNQHQCRKCGHVQHPMEVYEKIQKSGVSFDRAVEQSRRWELTRSLPMLQHHLNLLDKHVCLPWKDYATCVSTIKQCYRMEGNRDKDPSPLLS